MKKNYDNVYLRSLILGVIAEFHRKVRWINTWANKEQLITVPVYYTMVGDERFDIDAFIDEIVGVRPDLNIDPIPRAHFLLENTTLKRSEYSNPHVNIEYYKEIDGVLTKLLGKMRWLPIKANFKIEFLVSSEIDILKCQQSLWDFFFAYKYFYFKHNSIRIDAILDIPDDKQIEIIRQIEGIKGDTNKYCKFDFSINTYYPIEPIETKPIVATSCNKVQFYGNTRTLKNQITKKKYLGDY